MGPKLAQRPVRARRDGHVLVVSLNQVSEGGGSGFQACAEALGRQGHSRGEGHASGQRQPQEPPQQPPPADPALRSEPARPPTETVESSRTVSSWPCGHEHGADDSLIGRVFSNVSPQARQRYSYRGMLAS
jgi:hypothetical protein